MGETSKEVLFSDFFVNEFDVLELRVESKLCRWSSVWLSVSLIMERIARLNDEKSTRPLCVP